MGGQYSIRDNQKQREQGEFPIPSMLAAGGEKIAQQSTAFGP